MNKKYIVKWECKNSKRNKSGFSNFILITIDGKSILWKNCAVEKKTYLHPGAKLHTKKNKKYSKLSFMMNGSTQKNYHWLNETNQNEKYIIFI